MSILLVDDEQLMLQSLKKLVECEGYQKVEISTSAIDAREKIKNHKYDIVLLDFLMPEMTGLDLLKEVQNVLPFTEFIILTAVDDVKTAMSCIHLGAYDYLTKPVEPERLFHAIERAYERLGLRLGSLHGETSETGTIPPAFEKLIFSSNEIYKLIQYANVMARSGNPILISGESGTGKELMAEAIHNASQYAGGPFIAVNINSIPPSLFESQLFGHGKGAFTGATSNYKGFFEQAHRGSLFLDEIGDLPFELQSKLLRVIEEKRITRIGENRTIDVDCRIISATNKNISEACQANKFRLDLFYRLASAQVKIPPLQERKSDILTLADFFLQLANQKYDKNISGFSKDCRQSLLKHAFPGNARELQQLVFNGVLICKNEYLSSKDIGIENESVNDLQSRTLCSLKENTFAHIHYVLKETKGDKKQAAEILNISLRQMQRLVRELKNNSHWSDKINDI